MSLPAPPDYADARLVEVNGVFFVVPAERLDEWAKLDKGDGAEVPMWAVLVDPLTLRCIDPRYEPEKED